MRAALLLVVCAACARPPQRTPLDPDRFTVTVGASPLSSPLGDGAAPVSYVLADVDNRSGVDATVTLVGTWLGDGADELGPLRPEELHVPAGQLRTFALVDAGDRERTDVRGARVTIRTATQALASPPIVVADVALHDDPVEVEGGRAHRAVIGANLTNTADRPAQAIVFAVFRDRRGAAMTRPHQVVGMGAQVTRPVRFVGPPGSVDASIYPGDVVY